MRPAKQRSRLFRRVFVAFTGCAVLVALATLTRQLPDFAAVAELDARALPADLSISNAVSISLVAGEVQSTVIPPGKKSECPTGRLLVSGDGDKNPAKVALLDLDNLNLFPDWATFDEWEPLGMNFDDPDSGSRRIKSNDHDLISLPNGDVLLIKMGQTKWPLSPKPAWFDSTYKLARDTGDPDDVTDDKWVAEFGPGARSELFVWRSEDCGGFFDFVSSIDTATLDDDYGTADDASGGFPQYPRLNGQKVIASTPALGVIWQMGGTDGPLVRVDPKTGRIFVTIGLVGNRPFDFPGPFGLSDKPLDRTVVMMSSDNGTTWDRAAVLPFSAWRLDVVPRSNDTLAFADRGWDGQEGTAFVYPDHPIGFDILPVSQSPVYGAPIKTGPWGWDDHPFDDRPVLYKKTKEDDDYMYTNVPTQAVLTRSPSSNNLLLADPDTLDNLREGYRLYVYDGQSSWLHLLPISPSATHFDDFVFNLTPVDPGVGPLLFYWYDVDTISKKATIRGRLITRDNHETADFGVSWNQTGITGSM